MRRSHTKNLACSAMGFLLCLALLFSAPGEVSGLFFVDSALAASENDPSTSDDSDKFAAAEPILSGGPSIESGGAVVMEVYSGAVLYAKNPTTSLSPTSLTKLMTSLLAFERASFTDTVSCSYTAIHGIGKTVTRVGLEEDERLSVNDMLHAVIVASADEASYALGEKVGGSMKKFLTMMNDRMTSLGGLNTTFTSATGTGGSDQTSCAYDIGLVACALARYPAFMKMAGLKWYELPATNLNEARIIAQTHKFIRQTLTYDYAKAGKSGGADPNGRYSLCTYAERDGMTVVAIVMGSPSDSAAYDDTVSILNYAFENYESYSLKKLQGVINDNYTGLFTDCPMFSQNDFEWVYTDADSTVVLPLGADPSAITKTNEYFDLPEYVHGENVIGQILYRYQGKTVGKSNIIFFNQEFPMSQAEFDAVWPKFLLPPSTLLSQGGSGVPTTPGDTTDSPEAPETTPTPEKPAPTSESKGLSKPTVLAVVVFAITFLSCIIVIYVVLPYRKLKKNRQRRRL